MKTKTSLLLGLVILLGSQPLAFSQISEFIHVDQFGYHNTDTKVAVLSDPQIGYNSNLTYTPGSNLEVRVHGSDEVVYSGSPQLWENGATHSQSGDKGWWFDFSSVTNTGTYYIHDTQEDESSAPFEINANPYAEVLKSSIRMFYYNRCNDEKAAPFAQQQWTDGTNFTNPLQDANCRYIYDPTNTSLEKELTGGWFDAGDYNKYVTFAHTAIHELLGAYEDNPQIFGDDWSWPESGNGLPDILDEVKWELDWLIKMTNADGSVHIKQGSQNYSDNTASPPSLNVDQRFYGPTCSSASIAIASMFSRAAKVFSGQPTMTSYATTLQNHAENTFAYWKALYDQNGLEEDCDDGSIISGDADMNSDLQKRWGLIAAGYLFDLTGNAIYEQYIDGELYSQTPLIDDFWSPYELSVAEALLNYANLPNASNANATAILNSANSAVTNDYNQFYAFDEADLYRGQSPDWIYHWGSTLPKASIAVLCKIMEKYDVAPGSNSDLAFKASEQVHFFHGLNPLGLVLLSNMYQFGGDRCVNEIYHTWFNDGTDYDNALTSPLGPAPGFVTGGPNQYFSVPSLVPPSGQPLMKAYLDFNTGWPESSWEISEPAIYYQACYVRMLANMVNTSTATSTPNIAVSNQCVEIFPNPTDDFFSIIGNLQQYGIEIIDASGNVFQTINGLGSNATIDTSDLPAGMFFVKVSNTSNAEVCVQKVLKM